MITPKNFKVVV